MTKSKLRNFESDHRKMGIVQERCGFKPLREEGFADVGRKLDEYLRRTDPKFLANSDASTFRHKAYQARKRGE